MDDGLRAFPPGLFILRKIKRKKKEKEKRERKKNMLFC